MGESMMGKPARNALEVRTMDRERGNQGVETLAQALGWLSVGLGLAEVAAPGMVAGWIGLRESDKTRSLLRFYGVLEMAAGVGILAQRRPSGWLWGRVGGDLLDLATLGAAMTDDVADRTRLGAATAAVVGVTALDILCAQRLGEDDEPEEPKAVRKTIRVNRPVADVYRFWRDFENLPRFMENLQSVEVFDDRRSHWRAKGPFGRTVAWDAEIVEDRRDSLISWRSTEHADIENSGRVRFEPATGGRGTVIHVELEYRPPAGVAGAALAWLTGSEPGQQIDTDLRRFKQIMETGEVVKSDASIHTGMHPAQPPRQVPAETY